VYNISRLEYLLRGGLFNNTFIHDPRIIYMSWTYDSVALPFRMIKYGEALPSYACFLGIVLILYRIVKLFYSESTAWSVIATLCALPCLMYQATSTKPDIAVVFCFTCWFYAHVKYSLNKETKYVFIIALSLAFAAGAKPTGLLLAPFLGVTSLYLFYPQKSHLLKMLFYSIVCIMLWGSLEIYVNNYIQFRHILGPGTDENGNPDGISGALATTIRYLFENTTLGYESFFRNGSFLIRLWEYLCKEILLYLGIANKGIQNASTILLNDNNMRFLKEGTEVGSDYGLIGGCAIWYCIYRLIYDIRRISVFWLLNLFAILNLFIISIFVGWGLWGSRYFITTFMLWSVFLIINVEESKNKKLKYATRLIIIISIFLTTLCSFNKRPVDIIYSINNRMNYMTQENCAVQPILSDITNFKSPTKKIRLGLFPGRDAWTLPFFDLNNVVIVPVSNSKPITVYKDLVDYVLYLVKDPSAEELNHLKLIKKYYGSGGFWGRNSSVYIIN